MITGKVQLAVLIALGWFAGTAWAQSGNANLRVSPPFPSPGTNGDVLSINQGFGSYGLPGTSPHYQGYDLVGFGPAASLNDHGAPWVGPAAPVQNWKAKPLAGPMPRSPKATTSKKRPAVQPASPRNRPGNGS